VLKCLDIGPTHRFPGRNGEWVAEPVRGTDGERLFAGLRTLEQPSLRTS